MTSKVTPIRLGEITKGTDIRLNLTARDEGGAINLTGRTATVFDSSRHLSGRVSAEITDAENGKFTVFIEGTDPIPVGKHQFRVQLNQPDGDEIDSTALPVFLMEIV